MIYLDYASNTPLDEEVLAEYCRIERGFIANPNSAHGLGREAAVVLEESIGRIAAVLGVAPERVILTSGASEGNNLAIKGLAHAYRHTGRHMLATCLDHPSVSGTLTALQEQGAEVELVPLAKDGAIDLGALEDMLRPDTAVLAVTWVDPELGTVQPLEEIRAILAKWPNCRLHVDATQAVGKVPVCADGIDTLVFAPHKFYGPNGVGVLVKGEGVILTPQIHGGAGPSVYRSGTPTVALAAATALALEKAVAEREVRTARVKALRARLLEGLAGFEGVQVNSGHRAVPHTLDLSVKGVKGVTMQKALDERGVCVSVRSACSVPGTPSRAVMATTRDRKRALGAFRVSLSHLTTDEEVEGFLQAFGECYRELVEHA